MREVCKCPGIVDGRNIIYRFNSIVHPQVSLNDEYVRLINAAGEWRLHPLDENSTDLSYTWNGELLGDFPDWALTRAWQTQGNEIISWLKEAIHKQGDN